MRTTPANAASSYVRPVDDATESFGDVIIRIAFDVSIGNGDAHLKNWAVLYPDGMIWD
jgi:serine/threonine protein kinase HipA of HipAB toxin-antitoxin module